MTNLYEPNNEFTIYLSQIGEIPGFVIHHPASMRSIGWLAEADGRIAVKVLKESMEQLLKVDVPL